MKIRPVVVLGLALILAGAAAQGPQRWGLGPIGNKDSEYAWQTSRLAVNHQRNVNYDGRFTYARIAYTAGGGNFFGRRDPMWDHDYPNGDLNFPTILGAISSLRVRTDASIILRADDPDLFKYPFAYLCEVGAWTPTESEVLALRKYLLKGGFILVDDFRGQQALNNFVVQMRRIFPNVNPVLLNGQHAIFDSFYRIGDLRKFFDYSGEPPAFYGIFENNDPTSRMMMVVNHNFDVSEFWEYSATGQFAVDQTNEAYKLGVDYVFYTVTR